MDKNELLMLAAAVIGLAIVIKLWKQIAAVVGIGAVAVIFMCVSTDIQCPLDDWSFSMPSPPYKQPRPEIKPQTVFPDLDVKIITVPSVPFSCDSKFPIDVIVRNFGQGIARNIEVVSFSPYFTWKIPVLAPNTSKQERFYPKLTGWSRGRGLNSFQIYFMVDPSQRIAESNENNNQSDIKNIQCF